MNPRFFKNSNYQWNYKKKSTYNKETMSHWIKNGIWIKIVQSEIIEMKSSYYKGKIKINFLQQTN